MLCVNDMRFEAVIGAAEVVAVAMGVSIGTMSLDRARSQTIEASSYLEGSATARLGHLRRTCRQWHYWLLFQVDSARGSLIIRPWSLFALVRTRRRAMTATPVARWWSLTETCLSRLVAPVLGICFQSYLREPDDAMTARPS